MTDDKPNIHELKGMDAVASGIYLEGHYRAHQRIVARDLYEETPDRYESFEDALGQVEEMGSSGLSLEERDKVKRRGHMNLLMMGVLGDLSEEDIP